MTRHCVVAVTVSPRGILPLADKGARILLSPCTTSMDEAAADDDSEKLF